MIYTPSVGERCILCVRSMDELKVYYLENMTVVKCLAALRLTGKNLVRLAKR